MREDDQRGGGRLGHPGQVLITRVDGLRRFGVRGFNDRVACGGLVRLYNGVYVGGDATVDHPERVRAALLSTAHRATKATEAGLVAVDRSAALLHGFGVLPTDGVDLAGPPETTARGQPGIRLHGRVLAAAEVTDVGGIPVTTPARTAVDLVRVESEIDGLAVLDAALRIAACSTDDLAVQVEMERARRGIIRARRVVALADPRSESPMESRTRMRILAAGLPPPELQWEVRVGLHLYRLDLAWPERRVGVEYDGAVHLDRERQRYDLDRRTALIHAGWRILWVTDIDVYRRHRLFTRRLSDLLLSR